MGKPDVPCGLRMEGGRRLRLLRLLTTRRRAAPRNVCLLSCVGGRERRDGWVRVKLPYASGVVGGRGASSVAVARGVGWTSCFARLRCEFPSHDEDPNGPVEAINSWVGFLFFPSLPPCHVCVFSAPALPGPCGVAAVCPGTAWCGRPGRGWGVGWLAPWASTPQVGECSEWKALHPSLKGWSSHSLHTHPTVLDAPSMGRDLPPRAHTPPSHPLYVPRTPVPVCAR